MQWVWDSLWVWLANHFIISGWWEYLMWGAVASAVCFVVAFFFPPMRSFCGAVVFGIAAGLFGYRWAERDREKIDREREEREARLRESSWTNWWGRQ